MKEGGEGGNSVSNSWSMKKNDVSLVIKGEDTDKHISVRLSLYPLIGAMPYTLPPYIL